MTPLSTPTPTQEYQPPRLATVAEWREARLALLAREKEHMRAHDALSAARRALPVVEVEKAYEFDGPDGRVDLAGLFDGRRQLIVQHFMFFRETGEGCPGCSFMADSIPHLSHLHARDTTLVMVSRAPLPEIEPFRTRMGWTTPWYSSFGSDFNYDFHVTIDESVRPVEYNYMDKERLEARGLSYHTKGEQPGISVFLRDGSRVFHSYSTYGRGPDFLLNAHNFLDLTPFGRGEGKHGMPNLNVPLRHRDRYDA